jgi:Predicted integral membrane protein (DUF2269)
LAALTEPFFWLLFIHAGSAITGLGPSFIYGRIGQAGGKEPAHALFAMRLSRSLSTKWTHPLAFIVLASGFALIWMRGYNFFATGWLFASVALFLASFLYATFIQNRDLARLLDLMEQGPPDSLSADEQAEQLQLRKRIRYGGMFMRSIVVVVLFLMIFKPI